MKTNKGYKIGYIIGTILGGVILGLAALSLYKLLS